MNLRSALLVAACCVASASPALAQTGPRVTFADGRVSIVADNATINEILAEWTRVGGSAFVNADKMGSTERFTLRLENAFETRAIEILLRSASGYMVAPRVEGSASASSIARVFIMSPSRGATLAAATPSAPMGDDAPEPRPQFTPSTRPDDDGPVGVQVPPPIAMPPAPGAMMPSGPAGAASPLQGTTIQGSPTQGATTQTLPGGAVTSSQPGVTINNRAPQRPARPMVTPTRPGGGGR
ncbi:MAG: hypothetical protein M3R55_11210 [Acidobacteriota bacterium]|nr:hypothetical protein [Acidobacteriota bacterium]